MPESGKPEVLAAMRERIFRRSPGEPLLKTGAADRFRPRLLGHLQDSWSGQSWTATANPVYAAPFPAFETPLAVVSPTAVQASPGAPATTIPGATLPGTIPVPPGPPAVVRRDAMPAGGSGAIPPGTEERQLVRSDSPNDTAADARIAPTVTSPRHGGSASIAPVLQSHLRHPLLRLSRSPLGEHLEKGGEDLTRPSAPREGRSMAGWVIARTPAGAAPVTPAPPAAGAETRRTTGDTGSVTDPLGAPLHAGAGTPPQSARPSAEHDAIQTGGSQFSGQDVPARTLREPAAASLPDSGHRGSGGSGELPGTTRIPREADDASLPAEARVVTGDQAPPGQSDPQRVLRETLPPVRPAEATIASGDPASGEPQRVLRETLPPVRPAEGTIASGDPASGEPQRVLRESIAPARPAEATIASGDPASGEPQRVLRESIAPARPAAATIASGDPASGEPQRVLRESIAPARPAETTTAGDAPPSVEPQRVLRQSIEPVRPAEATIASGDPSSGGAQRIMRETLPPARPAEATIASGESLTVEPQHVFRERIDPVRPAEGTIASGESPTVEPQHVFRERIDPGRPAQATASGDPASAGSRPVMRQSIDPAPVSSAVVPSGDSPFAEPQRVLRAPIATARPSDVSIPGGEPASVEAQHNLRDAIAPVRPVPAIAGSDSVSAEPQPVLREAIAPARTTEAVNAVPQRVQREVITPPRAAEAVSAEPQRVLREPVATVRPAQTIAGDAASAEPQRVLREPIAPTRQREPAIPGREPLATNRMPDTIASARSAVSMEHPKPQPIVRATIVAQRIAEGALPPAEPGHRVFREAVTDGTPPVVDGARDPRGTRPLADASLGASEPIHVQRPTPSLPQDLSGATVMRQIRAGGAGRQKAKHAPTNSATMQAAPAVEPLLPVVSGLPANSTADAADAMGPAPQIHAQPASVQRSASDSSPAPALDVPLPPPASRLQPTIVHRSPGANSGSARPSTRDAVNPAGATSTNQQIVRRRADVDLAEPQLPSRMLVSPLAAVAAPAVARVQRSSGSAVPSYNRAVALHDTPEPVRGWNPVPHEYAELAAPRQLATRDSLPASGGTLWSKPERPSLDLVLRSAEPSGRRDWPAPTDWNVPQTLHHLQRAPDVGGGPAAPPSATTLPPEPAAPAPSPSNGSAAPPTDIAQLADRVYQLLVRKLNSERDRRGY